MFRHPRNLAPGKLMIMGFISVLLLGTLVLMLPSMTRDSVDLDFLDALFTAASSVCVTGLIVLDTGTDFTLHGQIVILALIQIGGLGIMSIAGVTSLLLRRGVSIRDAGLIQEIFIGEALVESRKILRFIILFALSVEVIGTALLYLGLSGAIPSPGERLWFAAFHAVSAFCNAGFSLSDASLIPLAANGLVTTTITALIVIGGLGFMAAANILVWLWGRRMRADARGYRTRRRLSVQARVIMTMTVSLLLCGAIALAALEWHGALDGLSPSMKISQVFFQSATARTAGFNTLDLTRLGEPALLVMIVLMLIGAAPGSTAGGIKVTTLAVLLVNLRAISLGSAHARLFNREIGDLQVRRAFMIASTYVVVMLLGLFVLLISEHRDFLETLFEVVSALGTVGLSLGLTATLSITGKIAVILLMFLGRLGPLAMAVYLIRPAQDRGVRYPEALLNVG